ncbi:MAG TPA: hypothetical protein VNX21_03025 [Candidatus Thermoplasmatota archaeon]|nr:hypothetical protein [Candidatus Thermoplasmatota archaeon]
MRRFEGRWQRWDEAVRAGERPVDFLPLLTDESIVELLASGDVHARRYELNLLAVEMLNRLARFRRYLGEAVEESAHAINAACEQADHAVRAAQAADAAIQQHMETRRDFEEGEPERARQARLAVQQAREALVRAVEAQEALQGLAEEAHARSRVSREGEGPGGGRTI